MRMFKNISLVVLISLMVLTTAVAALLGLGVIPYLWGRDYESLRFLPDLIFLLILPCVPVAALLLLTVSSMWLAFTWYGHRRPVRIGSLVLALAWAPTTVILMFSLDRRTSFLDGFADKVRAEVDFAEVRVWQSQLAPSEHDYFFNRDVLPRSFRGFRHPPVWARVSSDAKTVRYEFGGGFGHWGLIVLPEGATSKPDDYVGSLCQHPLARGVFAYTE